MNEQPPTPQQVRRAGAIRRPAREAWPPFHRERLVFEMMRHP